MFFRKDNNYGFVENGDYKKRITSVLKKNFDLNIFISGFFCNSILSIALTYLGQKLNLDIYLAALVVFVGRMFTNLTIIRRYYIEKWTAKKAEKGKELAQ